MASRGWVVMAVATASILSACGSDGSSAATPARPAPIPGRIVLAGTEEIDAHYAQGIAARGSGWVLSGTNVLGHADATGTVQDQVSPAIPAEWAAHNGGLELTVEGVVTVRAASADDAARLATSVLYSAMHIANLRQSVQPRAVSIQGGVTLAPTAVEDEDEDYDRYR